MNTNETPKSNAEEPALAQYRSICLMLEAVNFDYNYYSEMSDLADNSMGYSSDEGIEGAKEWLQENPKPFDDIDNADDAADHLREDALEVLVRTDWHYYGSTDIQTPTEFCILLCTGGPAVRIIGELDEDGSPMRAWLEYQDWGTPWTHLYIEGSNAILCRYASYYLGD
jgi:hypothetical protein